MNQHLHIVCLDNPYPPDYGGAIDMFYKIETLAALQIKIHLHYFEYNQRTEIGPLKEICESVYVYKKNTSWKGLTLSLPYIVSSRINQELIKNLNKDNHPIILEGLHCSGLIPFMNIEKRKIIVRVHNNEETYYTNLYKAEKNIFKKIYFAFEKYQLKKYQLKLTAEVIYACISEKETSYFISVLNLNKSFHLPPFVAWHEVNCKQGLGNYCLYHGNLAVSENEIAAIYLIKIFSKLRTTLIIAGNDPSKNIRQMLKNYSNIKLINNPSLIELDALIKNAQINILPSFTETGIKLKLLHALFEGRHCMVNEKMISGTGLSEICTIATDESEMTEVINKLYGKELTVEEIEKRKSVLKRNYDNTLNAKKLIKHHLEK